MRKIILASAAVLGLVTIGAAQAQAPGPDPVTQRKVQMRLHNGVLAGLTAAVQNKLEPKGFANAAGALNSSAGLLVGLFPAGSTANSRALPVIWSDAAGFAKQAADFGTAAEQTRVAAQAGDAAAFATGVKAITDNCNSCHQTFRGR